MKILVKKERDEIVASMCTDSGISDFNYVILINELYNGNKPAIEVEDTIAEEDKIRIEQMFAEICKTALSQKE